MSKQILALVLLLFAFSAGGCTNNEEPEKAAATTTPKPDPAVNFGQGFSGVEGSGDNTWRWMAGEGVVSLKNTGKEMKLRLVGDAPIEQLGSKPTIKLVLNGEVLDQFPGARNLEKEYVIPVAKQGNNPNSELRITTDKTLVPKEKDPKSNDGRVLGLSVRKIVWEAK